MYAPHIPINLASQPFRRDRALLVVSAVMSVVLVGLLALQGLTIYGQREASRESRESLDGLQRQVRALDQEQARLQARLHQPANEAVLDRSVFLNLLLQRKGISWTRMFSDLEGVFPGNVRLMAIRPYVTGDNRVQLDMVVGAQSPEPVIDLLKRLEDSPLFGETSLLNSQPPSQNEPLYRYRVSVNYAQKL